MTRTAPYSSTVLLGFAALLLSCGTSHAAQIQNGLIAFSDQVATGSTQLFTIQPDGIDRRQLTTLGDNLFPAWSPDGLRLAFVSTRTGNSELWVMNADGSNPMQLTFNTLGGNFTPEWSPDGSRIAFASLLDAVGHPEVWVMNADGSNAQQLTTTPVSQTGPTWSLLPTWSADSNRIAYSSTLTGTTQLWVFDADGSNPVQLTNGNGQGFPDSNAPAWSRDGAEIVFWSGFESQFGEVWAMQADGTNKRQLTQTLDPRNSDNPTWSPDGNKIIFDSNRNAPPTVEIWLADADGSNPQVLTSGAGQTSWQPVVIQGTPVSTLSLLGSAVLMLVILLIGLLMSSKAARPTENSQIM